MMPDHFIDHEAQELLGKVGIQISLCRQFAKARDLHFLTRRIGWRQRIFGFVPPNGLRHLEPLGEHVNQRGIDIVDALAELL